MDGFALFKKLGVGAKLDYKRFHCEAEQLQLTKGAKNYQVHSQSNSKTKRQYESQNISHSCDPSSRKNTGTDDIASKRKKFIDDIFHKRKKDSDERTDSNAFFQLNPAKDLSSQHEIADSSLDPSIISFSSSNSSESDGEIESGNSSNGDRPTSSVPGGKVGGSNKKNSPDISDDNEICSLQILGTIKSDKDNGDGEKMEKKKLHAHSKKGKLSLKQEMINHIKNIHKIRIYGSDKPEPITTFEEMKTKFDFHQQILKNITEMGYEKPTPVQMQVIPVMLQKRELLACAPTGSGKTAAFIIPILHQLKKTQQTGLRAVVLAPTRELAQQIYQEFKRLSVDLGFKIFYIRNASTENNKFINKNDVLVTTPNSLVYLLDQEQRTLSMKHVEWLVIDESDKLFEDGKSGFRDQLGVIYKSCDNPAIRHAMFSATFAYDVIEWCKLNLDNVVQVYIGGKNVATNTIEQHLEFVGSEAGKLIAVRDLIKRGIQPPVLVFVQSKERAKELYRELIYDKINVDMIHSDRTQLQRENVVKNFRAGKTWVLICTELMGRGMDFKGVNLVINYDFPNSAISYIHRIGRTGRAGRPGKAITYFTESDVVNLRDIANVMREAGCEVPEYMLKIRRPGKKVRKKMAKTVPERDTISTIPEYDIEKLNRKKKKKIIQKARMDKLMKKENSAVHRKNNSSTDASTKQKSAVLHKKLKYLQTTETFSKKRKKSGRKIHKNTVM